MTDQTDIRKLIDAFLRANKILTGDAWWQADQNENCRRWTRPVEVDGEQPGIQLVIKAYLRTDGLKFRIMLNAPRCFWRLDFANDGHVNPLDAPALGGIVITEPHYHPWSDNRHLAKSNALPAKLHNARVLPPSIRNFDAAFRWFCTETNISVLTSEIPDLPKKDTLL